VKKQYLVQLTAVASVWREELVEADSPEQAADIAAERAKADSGYPDAGSKWELNGLLAAAGDCSIQATEVQIGGDDGFEPVEDW
jgi:hypothetical protein